VIKRLLRTPQTRINTGFLRCFNLFPLDGRGRLGGDVVDDPVYTRNLIDNPAADLLQHLIRDAGPVAGHTVDAGNRADRDSVVIGTPVAHNADAADVGQDGEILPDLTVEAGAGDLLAQDRVR